MRKVVLYQLLSADGVAEEPGDWMADEGPEVLDNLRRVIDTQDTVLLGRRTFEYWVGFWPADGPEPFREFINRTPKHVVTSRPLAPGWSGATAVTGPVVDHVRSLARSEGGDIGIHGSTTLARSLLHAGLVDELRLVVAPALAGSGRRLFDGSDRLRRLEATRVERTRGGTLLLDYRVVGGQGASGCSPT